MKCEVIGAISGSLEVLENQRSVWAVRAMAGGVD